MQKVHVAEKALDSARTEAEAVSEMLDQKKSMSDAAESQLQNVTNTATDMFHQATDMAKLAKDKKEGGHVEEKRAEHTDEKKAGATPEKVTESKALPVVPASEKNATPSTDVDSKLAVLKTQNERLKLEKERLAKQLQAQELEEQNEKLAKEKEELEKKVQSKTSDGDKKNQSAPAQISSIT